MLHDKNSQMLIFFSNDPYDFNFSFPVTYYYCSECPESFLTAKQLVAHKRTHPGIHLYCRVGNSTLFLRKLRLKIGFFYLFSPFVFVLHPLCFFLSFLLSFFLCFTVIGMDFYVYATLSPSTKFKWDMTRFGV